MNSDLDLRLIQGLIILKFGGVVNDGFYRDLGNDVFKRLNMDHVVADVLSDRTIKHRIYQNMWADAPYGLWVRGGEDYHEKIILKVIEEIENLRKPKEQFHYVGVTLSQTTVHPNTFGPVQSLYLWYNNE